MSKALKIVCLLLCVFVVFACKKPAENNPIFETFEDNYVLSLYNGVEMFVSSLGIDDEIAERKYERKLRKVQIHVGSATSAIPGVVYLLGKDSSSVYYQTTFDYESQQFTWTEIIGSSLDLHELVNVNGVPYSLDKNGNALVQMDFTKENIANRIPLFGAELPFNPVFCSDGEFIYTTSGSQLTVINPITGEITTRKISPNNALGSFGNFQHVRHAYDNLFAACRMGSDAIEVGYLLIPDSGDVQHFPKTVIPNFQLDRNIVDAIYSPLFDEYYIGIVEDKTRDPYSIFKVDMYRNTVTKNIVEDPFQALQIGETIKVIER